MSWRVPTGESLRLPWAKAWREDLLRDPRLEGLGQPERHLYLVTCLLAGEGGIADDDGTAWLLTLAGRPRSIRGLGEECRMSAGRTAQAASALVERGLLVRREDGAIGWAGWVQLQERAPSTATARQRRYDERRRQTAKRARAAEAARAQFRLAFDADAERESA